MKRAFLAAALIIASSVVFADTTSVLLNSEMVRNMSAEEYAEVVRSAPNVNVRNELSYETPLHIAAIFGTPDNIAALVSAGADVEVRNRWGITPLISAVLYGSSTTIAALLDARADANVRDIYGDTPLLYAARSRSPDIITALLEAGASGSAKDEDGKTPFDLAEENELVKGTAAYWALNDAQYE